MPNPESLRSRIDIPEVFVDSEKIQIEKFFTGAERNVDGNWRGLSAEEVFQKFTDRFSNTELGGTSAENESFFLNTLNQIGYPLEKEALEEDQKIEKITDALKDTPFFGEESYGCVKAIEGLLEDFHNGKINRAEHLQLMKKLVEGANAIEKVTDGIPFPFFASHADNTFAPANKLFADCINDRTGDWEKAFALAEIEGNKIKADYENFQESQQALRDPKRIQRSIEHCLLDEQNLQELKNDPTKIVRLLKDRYGLTFSDTFDEGYLMDNLGNQYIQAVEQGYQRQLEANKQSIERGHEAILQESEGLFFASQADFEAYVKQAMRDKFPLEKNGKEVRYMPDNQWDNIKARNLRLAEKNWEDRIKKGETASWKILDKGLQDLESKNFGKEADFVKFLKDIAGTVEKSQLLPNEAWDANIKEKFKHKAEAAWENHLEKRTGQIWKTLDSKLAMAASQKFDSKKDLIAFIQAETGLLNQQKLIPDEHWDKVVATNLRAKVEGIWTARDKEKKGDLDRVQAAMKSVSLENHGKPQSVDDFYRIAKQNLPKDIQGKLTDAEWDAQMCNHFYPRVKAQLKANEAIVQSAMHSLSLPDASATKNQAEYIDLVKAAFAQQNPQALGIIPNNRYNTFRDRILIMKAKEGWKSQEQSEAGTLDQAREALSPANVLKTVHHFAKNKQNPEPTTAEIKASSAHALAAQFGLNPDQIKQLNSELNHYASQVKNEHASHRRSALKSVKQYKVPDNVNFSNAELANTDSFRAAVAQKVGDMQFLHPRDWYLVLPEAMSHLESLRKVQLIRPESEREEASALVDTETVVEIDEITPEEGSKEVTENIAEAATETPTEQSEWMKQYGIAPETVSQQGVDRFQQIMQLPEFNLGGIPNSDLRTALPALINMLGGFRETTWKNFSTTLRTDLRSLEDKSPQSRFFQVIKSFAMGFCYKPTDFDVVPGVSTTFNNLVKRMKGPDGEKFTTIKNLYLHFNVGAEAVVEGLELEDVLDAVSTDLEVLLNEEVSEEVVAPVLEEAIAEAPVELLAIETDLDEVVDEPIEPEIEVVDPELEEVVVIEPEIVEPPIEIEAETEIKEVAEEAELAPEIETEIPDATAEVAVEDSEVLASEEAIDEVVVDEDVAESAHESEIIDESFEKFGDYLEEGAEILQAADQILRTEPVIETLTGEDHPVLEEVATSAQQPPESTLEEKTVPVKEAAEVMPEKLYKSLTKLKHSGLLSDAAISWLIEEGTEFYVADDQAFMSLGQVLQLIHQTLRSQFLGKHINLEIKLSAKICALPVSDLHEFIAQFMMQAQSVDGLQKIRISKHKKGLLSGYWETRFGKKPFTVTCHLILSQKKVNRLA